MYGVRAGAGDGALYRHAVTFVELLPQLIVQPLLVSSTFDCMVGPHTGM